MTGKERWIRNLPKAGKYEVRLAVPYSGNRASNAKVTVTHKGGEKVITVNQKEKPEIDGLFVSLGTFDFGTEASVTISNEGANGFVVADAVQWLPK